MGKNIYTIVQITGDILELTEEVEYKDGQTLRHYTFDVKEPEEIPEFIRGLIIQ